MSYNFIGLFLIFINFIHNIIIKLKEYNITLPTKLHWLLFPIEDLRQTVETAKRILTMEKVDRQLAGQSSLMNFMNIKDGYISRKVTFDRQGSLDEKTNRFTSMMSKLTAHDVDQNKQFKPKKSKQNERTNEKFL